MGMKKLKSPLKRSFILDNSVIISEGKDREREGRREKESEEETDRQTDRQTDRGRGYRKNGWRASYLSLLRLTQPTGCPWVKSLPDAELRSG